MTSPDQSQRWNLLEGDALDMLKTLPDGTVDAVVTDPPYGLSKAPDIVEVMTKWAAGEDYQHRGSGFQGQTWDSFVPGPSVWREVYRTLKPGGHALVFSSARTQDLTAVSLRMAGFEIRDTLVYLYGCLDDESEVLTEHGWRSGLDVKVGDRVMQWDHETGVMSLTEVEETFRGPWDGPMKVLRNADTDQLLTPNHRVYYRTHRTRTKDGVKTYLREEDWSVSEAREIGRGYPVDFPISGEHDGEGIGGEDYAALLGWVWTEGGFDKKGTGVRIYQSSVNQSEVDEVTALMDRLGPHKRYDRDRTYTRRNGNEHTYTESTWFFSGEMAERVRADLPDKHPTYSLLWRMTLSEKRALLRAAVLGDGSGWGSSRQTFYQSGEDDLVWFQTLLHTMGLAGKVALRTDRDYGSVDIRRRATTQLQHRHLRDDEEHYKGDVWCVKVPTGAFVARRRGKVFITGNSAFPKSHNISKAIDKLGGDPKFLKRMADAIRQARETRGWSVAQADKHFCGGSTNWAWIEGRRDPIQLPGVELCERLAAEWPELEDVMTEARKKGELLGRKVHARGGGEQDFAKVVGSKGTPREVDVYGHATVQAAQWEGWGTALKPAYEPVIMVRKPFVGTVAANVLTHGTGGINVDGTRVVPEGAPEGTQGRWPANVLFDEHAAQLLDDESDPRYHGKSGVAVQRNGGGQALFKHANSVGKRQDVGFGDSGGPSRFFYSAKASKKERNAGLPDGTLNEHPTVKPVEVMRWLIRLVTPEGGLVLDPFTGSGSTGCAAMCENVRFLGIDREPDYVAIASQRIAHWENENSQMPLRN